MIWIAVGALLLCALAWWQLKSPPSEMAPPPRAAQTATPETPPPPTARAPTVVQPVTSPTTATRPAPRPPPTTTSSRVELPRPPPAQNQDSRYYVPPPDTMLRDRRDRPGPHAQRERVAVGYALDTLDDDIQSCLDEWKKSDVTIQGSLMLSIEIDANGVQKAWIDRDGGLPLGPQSCFSNAVYGIDWSHMVDSPAKITRPYSFDEDGGS